MNEAEKDTKERNSVIAENESARQTSGDVRVSAWAIAITALVALAVLSLTLLLVGAGRVLAGHPQRSRPRDPERAR